jgi:hypothetical protein
MRPFKQSTAVTIRIGPCLDSTGAEYTGLVIGDLTLTKAGTSAAMAAAATLTHIANGHYSLVTIAGNTDTLGSLRIDCNKATYQIPPVEGEVLPATVFDALVTNAAGGANGLLLSLASNQVDVGKFKGTGITESVGGRFAGAISAVLDVDPTTCGTWASVPRALPTDVGGSRDVYRVGGTVQTAGDLYSYLTTNLGALGANLSAIPKTGFKLASDGLAQVSAWTVAITGNITGNLSGSVGSVTAFSAAAIQSIWDALTSALTTTGSIGKMLVDKLNGVSGQVASQSEVTGIQNNTRTVLVVPEVIERPDSGTDTYLIHLYLYDEVGNMEAPDSAPTLALANSAGTDRSARLGSTTGTLVGTGHYKWVYTNTSTDTLEQLLWEFSVVEGGATRLFGRQSLLVDTTAVDFTASDRTTLNAAATAAALATLSTKIGTPEGASVSADIAALPTNAELASALAAADDATLAQILAVSKLLRADRKIDKTTDPLHWDEVLLEEGTANELVRRELFDVDGTALAAETTRIGRAIKP